MKTNLWREFDIISFIKKRNFPFNSSVLVDIGDDAAVITPQKNNLVFTCDTQVENIHFKKKCMTPQQIGERAVAAAISDIAAIGGVPKFLLTTLFLSPKLEETYVQNLSKGLAKASKQYGAQIIGGNITKSPVLAIDVFAIGESSGKYLTRDKAKVDDTVCVTGILGDAHTALLQEKYFKINPRIEEGKLLAKTGLINAMIDISDILHICKQSDVGVELFFEKLPKRPKTPSDFALHGGEDYELCFTTDPKNIELIKHLVKKQIGTRITVIGKILPKEKGRWLINKNGKKLPLLPLGWEHSS